MPRDDPDTILDMANAAQSIRKFLAGIDRRAFLEDQEKQSSVLHQMMILGEAAKRLSPAFRAAHPEMPWTNIAGMRDRLIHLYNEVDLQLVWDTATNSVPRLLAFLQPHLPPPPQPP